jgi:hypothetical protein
LPAVLSSLGVDCWIDKEGLRGGDEWDGRIQKVIAEECDYVVILASRNMISERKYFNKEIRLAIDRQSYSNPNFKTIIPVLLKADPSLAKRLLEKINPALTKWQALDLQQPDGVLILASAILDDWRKRQEWKQNET